ncbi:bucentaur or craniofacial development-domain-containing protein [Pestalotiopsis sp. NC0098]|nr:bucentaur or craniofacial development-domain-containing protein [Pestalotiopsis sp. NC0098]
MSTDPLIDDEYASEDDSDFALDDAARRDASDASESEDDDGEQATAATAAAQPSAKRKRAAGDDAEDDGYDNSGDEAIISKGKKKQKKRNKGNKDDAAAADEDDEGGEGGLVMTRSMRANEKAERRVAAASGPVTVDVDDLWARMMAGPIVPPKSSVIAPADATDAQQTTPAEDATNGAGVAQEITAPAKDPSGMIKIKRTYNFAGKVHTEEKVVPRDSAEAKVYLATLGEGAAAEAADNEVDEDEPTKRQPRRAFRSAFEPITTDGSAQRSDLNLGMAARLQMRESNQKAKKLNVVEKSRMDWAGFVDQEGIKDELELAGKSKQSYASRQDFLARVEANRDEDARRIRLAGRA